MDPFKHIDVTMDKDNYDSDVRRVAKEVRPGWKEIDIKIRPLGGGFNNITLKVTHGDSDKDGLILRINGEGGDLIGMSHEKELKYIRMYNKHGYGVPLLASFNNGLVHKLSTGRALDQEDMQQFMADPAFAKKLAKLIARMQNVSTQSETTINKDEYIMWVMAQKSIVQIRKLQHEDEGIKKVTDFMSADELEKECNLMQSEIEKLSMPVCLSHNDVWNANILYDKDTDTVELIDYETTDINYEPYDVATFIWCATKSEFLPGVASSTSSKNPVGPGFTKHFVRSYLEEKAELKGKTASSVTDADVEKYLEWIKICILHLAAFWAPVVVYMTYYQAKRGMEIDYAEASITYAKEYYALKKEHGY